MNSSVRQALSTIFKVRWNPGKDLAIVALSWVLVVAALYTATVIVGQSVWGGMGYFLLYAVLGATIFGVGIPVFWMVVVRKRSLADLGITKKYLGLSLILQLVFAGLQYYGHPGQNRNACH